MLTSLLATITILTIPSVDREPIIAILLLGLLAWFLLFAVLRLVFALIQAFYATMIISVIVLVGLYILGFGRASKTPNKTDPAVTTPSAALVRVSESFG